MPKISKRGLGNRLITQKAHPADLRAGPFWLAVGSWREWDCQTFLSYGYEDPSCTDGVAPL